MNAASSDSNAAQSSYITSAAVEIGNHILQVASYGNYALNGVVTATDPPGKHGDVLDLAGFPVYVQTHLAAPMGSPKVATNDVVEHDSKAMAYYMYDIVVGHEENITISSYQDHVSVKVTGGTRDHFGTAKGLLGTFDGNLWLRNGRSPSQMEPGKDATQVLAYNWQVKAVDPLLFRTQREPQFPNRCRMEAYNKNFPPTKAPATNMRRRLLSTTDHHHPHNATAKLDLEQAAKRACAHLPKELYDNCLFDAKADGVGVAF